MRIALDGCDGTGKTTICEKLTRVHHCNLIKLITQGDRSTRGYIELMSANNVIHDRTFMSEIIYPKYFNRETRLCAEDIPALFRMTQVFRINTFILTASTESILSRIRVRGDEYIKDMSLFEKINADYLALAKANNVPIIDTTNKTIDEIVEEIGGRLKYDS